VKKINNSVESFSYHEKMFPFSIYLGSFLSVEKAERAITLYEQKGIFPFWVKINLEEKGIWYRVYAGCFGEHEQAQRFIRENGLKEADIKKTVYANLIGIYNTSEDLESMFQTIKDLGYSPYVVKDQDNTTPTLFVGAFTSRAGAEEQDRDLQSDGVINRVVER
jgi:cell division septation protein DedD